MSSPTVSVETPTIKKEVCVNCNEVLKSISYDVEWIHRKGDASIYERYCGKACFTKNPYRKLRSKTYFIKEL